jgi:hypothetical protein
MTMQIYMLYNMFCKLFKLYSLQMHLFNLYKHVQMSDITLIISTIIKIS